MKPILNFFSQILKYIYIKIRNIFNKKAPKRSKQDNNSSSYVTKTKLTKLNTGTETHSIENLPQKFPPKETHQSGARNNISFSTSTSFKKSTPCANVTSQRDIQINYIIAFMKKHNDFFTAPFLNQEKFAQWASRQESTKKFSEALFKAMMREDKTFSKRYSSLKKIQMQTSGIFKINFYEEIKSSAIFSKYKNAITGSERLSNNKDTALKTFLEDKPAIRKVLIAHIDNKNFINDIKSYENKFQPQAEQTSTSRLNL